MPRAKLFYVLYVRDPVIGPCLNAIRLLCNPEAKWMSHVTVRGPLERTEDVSTFNRQLEGIEITITGVGTFGGDVGHLTAQAPGLREAWHKPDFSGEFAPHITICRGPLWAEVAPIFEKYLRQAQPVFLAGKLELLVSASGGGPGNLSRSGCLDAEVVRQSIGSTRIEEVAQISLGEKLNYINRLAWPLFNSERVSH